jgi:hypothetical protein
MPVVEVVYRDGTVLVDATADASAAMAFHTNLNSQRTAITLPNGTSVNRSLVSYAHVK